MDETTPDRSKFRLANRGVAEKVFKKINRELINGSGDTTTLISAGTKINGDIEFSGNLETLGSVVGNISSRHTNSRVRVLQGGSVQGDIQCPLVVINGNTQGDIHALDRLCLEAQCRVEGNVRYSSVEMQSGAQVFGSFDYQPPNNEKSSVVEAKVSETTNVKSINSK